MNYRMILSLLGDVLLVIGAFSAGFLSCCGRSAAVSCTRVTAS